MKRAPRWLLSLVIGITVLSACQAEPVADVPSDSTIRIGANLELSGAHGETGNSVLQGMQLAINQINSAGGLRGGEVVLLSADNQSDPAKAVTMATRLSTQDKATAIIGPASADVFNYAASVTSHREVPNLTPMATTGTALLNPDGELYPFAYRIAVSDPAQGAAMARFATGTLSADRALVIRDAGAGWANEMADGFVAAFSEAGGTVVNDAGYQGDPGALASQVSGQDYDVVYLAAHVNQAAALIGPLRSAGISAPILGTDSFALPALVEVAGQVSDVYYPTQFMGQDLANPLVGPFVESFRATFGLEPNAAAALGYDAMLVLADAISRADAVGPAEINQALLTTSSFEGVTGTYWFDATHEPDKAPLVIEISNGQPKTVQRAW